MIIKIAYATAFLLCNTSVWQGTWVLHITPNVTLNYDKSYWSELNTIKLDMVGTDTADRDLNTNWVISLLYLLHYTSI